MNAKATAEQVIGNLPKNASMDEIMYALYVTTKIDKGIQDIRAGHGISHEEVKARMKKWQR